MSTVLFFMLYDIDNLNNNNSKLAQQMHAAEEIGLDVSYIGYSSKGIYYCHNREKIKICNSLNLQKNFIKRMEIFRACKKLLKSYSFDFCYIRKMITTFNYGLCLKKMKKKGIKLTVEIPTYPDYDEYEKDRRKIRRLVFRVLKIIDIHFSKYVDMFTLIGEKSNSYFGVRAINIENGININNISQWVHDPQIDMNILILANFCSWHGYERLIYGLKAYYDSDKETTNIIIHMVGPDEDGSLKEWLTLANRLGIQNHFISHGRQYGKELDEIANKCDLAIAGLGLYKKNLFNASELKVLNYCARGIPFVYCSESLEDSEIGNLCYKISNDESALDIYEILAFYNSIRNERNISNRLRKYCAQKYTWNAQLTKVFRGLGWNG